jgi:CHAD domain-containing protein
VSDNGSGQTIADVLGQYIAEQCDVVRSISAEMEAALPNDLSSITDDQVHDTRVACRRLRSITRVFDDLFSVPEAGRLSDDAQWFALRLGAVRDLDVLTARLGSDLDEIDHELILHHAREELAGQLRYRREIAIADLRDGLHNELYGDLQDQLQRWRKQPPWTPEAQQPATKIKKYVKHAEKQLAKRLRRAAAAIAAADPEADEMIHSARKAGKRHRYAAEAATPVMGSSSGKIVAARKELQDLLGDYQDSRLASTLLRDLGGIPGRNGFTFGLLYAKEAEHRKDLRKLVAKRAKNL